LFIFKRTRQILQFFVKFSLIFSEFRRILKQNFSDFDKSYAKIAIFQRIVNKLLKFFWKLCEDLSEKCML